MSDDLPIFEPPPMKRPRKHNEHSFQAWADRLIDRIVLPPMFVTGIDHASQMSDNARARMAARGIRFGLPDMFVCQRHHQHAIWIELKRGSGLSESQKAVHEAMFKAGQNVAVCRTMADIVAALAGVGFQLHPNAHALAAEYEARLEASERAPPKPRYPRARSSGKKVTASHIRRVEKIMRSVGR